MGVPKLAATGDPIQDIIPRDSRLCDTLPHTLLDYLPEQELWSLSGGAGELCPCQVLLLWPSWSWLSPLWPDSVCVPGEAPESSDLPDTDSDLHNPPDLPTPDLLANVQASQEKTQEA